MSDIPVCQQCGKKLYMNYGRRGLLATPDYQFYHETFNTEEERNNYERDELPENAFDVDRHEPNRHYKTWRIYYSTPQQPRAGLFHSRHCWEEWHYDHRDDIERVIRSRGEWRS